MQVISVRPSVPPGSRGRLAARRTLGAGAMMLAAACSATDAVGPSDVPEDVGAARKPKDGGGAGVPTTVSPLAGLRLYAAPGSDATRQADSWVTTRPADADLMRRMGAQPVARWLTEWTGDVTTSVNTTLSSAAASGTTPVFVAYNIPNRDCNGFSAGGAAKADAYRSWIRAFASGLLGRRAVVILEPDAVAGAGCLSATLQQERFTLLREAVDVLSNAGAMVYLDAGHPRWLSTETAAARLLESGIGRAQGFALNVSNFVSTDENVGYGNALSAKVGGKRYVIDTSRNGLGPAASGAWCNPDGRALGTLPTTQSAHALVDALLWVKVPGESDGACNGGPGAGVWWAEYGLGLAARSTAL